MARTRWLALLLVGILTFLVGQAGVVYVNACEEDHPEEETGEPVYFADANLASAVRDALCVGKDKEIYSGRLGTLESLYANGRNIGDLTGLEWATGLKTLKLYDNQITDLYPLSGLTNLRTLYLYNNKISDISPLQNLTNLKTLKLWNNPIADYWPLLQMEALEKVHLDASAEDVIAQLKEKGIEVESIRVIPVEEVKLEISELTLQTGEYKKLYAKVLPENASNKGVTWSSDNVEVAKVTEEGKIYAISPGITIVTVTTNDGEKTAQCTVTVIASTSVTKVEVTPEKITLKVGESKQLSHKVYPENAANKNVTWYSENTKIAKVSEGKVTALSPGTTKIKVKTNEGGKIAWCTVTVTAKDTPPEDPEIPVTGVTLSHDNLSMAPGEHLQLEAAVIPADADNKKLTWSSDNTAVAKVDGGKVTAIRPGTAAITVTSKDGSHTAVCQITVSAPEPTEAAFKYTNKTLKVGTEKKLHLIVSPEGAWAEWSWQSSNPEVASVDSQGNVSTFAAGETIISATAGDITASCVLTVVTPEEGEEIQYELDKPKNCLSIPKDVLEEKDQLDIKQGKMQIVIPTNAWLDALAELELESSEGVLIEVEEYEPSVSGKLMAVGPAYNFNLTVDEVKVSNFADKLLLTINYDPAAVKKPEKLAIYWFNEETGAWDKLPSIVDSENHTVSALINHWSSFALLQPAADSVNTLLYILLGALGLNAVLIVIWLVKRR